MCASVADGRKLNLHALHQIGGWSSDSGIWAAVSRFRGRYGVGCGMEVSVRTVLLWRSMRLALVVGAGSTIGPVLLLMSCPQFASGVKRCVQSNCGSVELVDRCCGTSPNFEVGTSLRSDGPM